MENTGTAELTFEERVARLAPRNERRKIHRQDGLSEALANKVEGYSPLLNCFVFDLRSNIDGMDSFPLTEDFITGRRIGRRAYPAPFDSRFVADLRHNEVSYAEDEIPVGFVGIVYSMTIEIYLGVSSFNGQRPRIMQASLRHSPLPATVDGTLRLLGKLPARLDVVGQLGARLPSIQGRIGRPAVFEVSEAVLAKLNFYLGEADSG